MAKQSQLDKAIAEVEGEILMLQAVHTRLLAARDAKVARKPRVKKKAAVGAAATE